MTAGSVLFLLDLAAVLVAWPLFLAVGCAASACLNSVPDAFTALIFPIANMTSLYAMGLYRRDGVVRTRQSLALVPLAVGLGAVGSLLLSALVGGGVGSGRLQISLFAAAIVGFTGCAVAARIAFSALKRRGVFRRRVLIVGAGPRAWDLVWMLTNEGTTPHYDITFVHDPGFGDIDARLIAEHPGKIERIAKQSVLDVALRTGADEIVVAPDERRGMQFEDLLACKAAGFPVTQYLTFLEHEIRRVDIKRIEVGWLLYSSGFYFGTIDRILKRALDLAVSAVSLAVFLPLLLCAAIAIKLGDRGPILYSQERVTKGGRSFRIYKMRTMRTDAERAGAVWAAAGDQRVTRVGRFLRRTRIDEIPQLLNVLSGDMSLVGPRPERPNFVDDLARVLPLYNERHRVKAGLTGWAQINYPYGASIDDARSKLSYDLYYVKNFSILFDLLIILQTIRVVLTPSGAR